MYWSGQGAVVTVSRLVFRLAPNCRYNVFGGDSTFVSTDLFLPQLPLLLDLAKSPHLARIANSVYREHCPDDPTCRDFGFLVSNLH